MYTIFISYRRSDLSLEAEWINNVISTFFGNQVAFFDTQEIEGGKRWDEALRTCVYDANIVLVLIGPKWLKEQLPSGMRRLDDPGDWVRKELITALESYKQHPNQRWIYSVLLNGASFPEKEWLPKKLAELFFHQHHKSFQFDIKNYMEAAQEIYNVINQQLTKLKGMNLLPGIQAEPFDYNKVPNPYELFGYQLPEELRNKRPSEPFKGLEYFKREDAKVFFGRRKEIAEIIDFLKKPDTVIRMYGQSGVGKSSLLFAGLLPRLESQDWQIISVRREPPEAYAKTLEKKTKAFLKTPSTQSLIVLDQVEEIITAPIPELGTELADLAGMIKKLETLHSSGKKKIFFILSYRNEYDVNISHALKEKSVESNEYWLKDLDDNGMREAIVGITKDQNLNAKFHLQIEKGLDDVIVNELLHKGSKENASPLLQILLRKMWDRVKKNDIDERVFTKELYDECKSLDLQKLLDERFKSIQKQSGLIDAVTSGLALDVLRRFTSELDTAKAKKEETILGFYRDASFIKKLLQAFVDVYLLVRLENKNYRLPHDSLAKAVRLRYNASQLPGQRASRLLESKEKDIEKNPGEVGFSNEDIVILFAGKMGMREWSEKENEVIEKTRSQREKEQEEWHRSYQVSLARQLAAQAQVIITFEASEVTDRALLLAVEAMRRCTTLDIPSLEADQALRQGLALHARRVTYIDLQQSVDANAVSVHPRDALVAFGRDDGQTMIWNLSAGKIDAGARLTAAIRQMAYSQDGQWLVIGDASGNCVLVNTVTAETRNLNSSDKNGPVHAVTFSADNSYLAAAIQNLIVIWGVNTFDDPVVIDITEEFGPVVSMTFSRDATTLITQMLGSQALCWNWKSKEIVGRLGSHGKQVLHNPDGRFLGITGTDFVSLLWDVYKLESHEIANNSAKLAFSADGRFVGIASPEHFARIWHLPDLNVAHTFRHDAEVWNLDFSPDSSMLVTVAKNGVARVWQTHSGKEIARIVHNGHVNSAKFLFSNRYLLTHSGTSIFNLWDVLELSEVRLIKHQVAVLGVAFSPDSRYLATHAREGMGRLVPLLIDLDSYQPVETLQLTDGQMVKGGVYAQELLEKHKQLTEDKTRSLNRKFLAVAEGKAVKIYKCDDEDSNADLRQSELFCTLPHDHNVLRMVFTPDSQHLVTASDHDTARIWDVNRGTEVSRLIHEVPNVVDVDVNPSGNLVATASWDGTARVWVWKPEELIHEAATRLTRNLSVEEWRKYLPNEQYRKTIAEIGD